jgi:glycerol-3-phosphate acyltransferase PlsY
MSIGLLIALAIGYVIGATPFGYLAGRMRGLDIRQHGSGNIGATNALRVLGKPIGLTVFALDFLKGLVAVLICKALPLTSGFGGPDLAGVAAAIGVILGHNFTFWLGFKGGKGIATSGGVLVALVPVTALVGIATWVTFFFASRYVSLASLAAAVSLPLSTGTALAIGRGSPVMFAFTLLACVMAFVRHKTNIQRLLNGTEPRFQRKAKTAE